MEKTGDARDRAVEETRKVFDFVISQRSPSEKIWTGIGGLSLGSTRMVEGALSPSGVKSMNDTLASNMNEALMSMKEIWVDCVWYCCSLVEMAVV